MPTIEELQEKITKLETDALETAVLVKELEKRPAVEPVEKQVQLKWPHKVDTNTGAEPSAYGIKLVKKGKSYFGTMSEIRSKVERGRKTKSFV